MARFENGWIKVDRRVAYDDIAQRGNFTLGVWVRLMAMAQWSGGSSYVLGQQVKLVRGQIVTGLRELSPNIEEDPHLHRVRTALRYLEKSARIAQESSNQGRIITILNYEPYQEKEEDCSNHSASKEHTPSKQSANPPQHIEEGKKEEVVQGEIVSSKKKEKKSPPRGAIQEFRNSILLVEALAEVTEKTQRTWLETYQNISWIRNELLRAVSYYDEEGTILERPGIAFSTWLGRSNKKKPPKKQSTLPAPATPQPTEDSSANGDSASLRAKKELAAKQKNTPNSEQDLFQ